MSESTNQPRTDLPNMEYPPEQDRLHDWAEAEQGLEAANTYWLSTVRPDGRPHVMPVWGVWLDNAFYFATSPTSRKGKNLAANPSCVISVSRHTLDIVIEGKAARVEDEGELQRVVEVYSPKYDWPLTVRDGGAYSENGDGGPVYRVRPTTAFGFGESGGFTATRWRF